MTDLVTVRPMLVGDLAEATRIFRVAFGTFFKVPDPGRFRLDLSLIETRWRTDPAAAFVAERDGRVVGSVIGMDWGSQLVLGPLTVDPEFWGKGVARLLVPAILELAAQRAINLTTLFTFPQSASHLRLYESFGFVPMFLTPLMSKAPDGAAPRLDVHVFSLLSPDEQVVVLERSRALTDTVLDGLDLRREIHAVEAQRLGETILVESGGIFAGFAICHIGAGTEAGDGALFVKFAAVRPGAAEDFERLLDAVDALAAQRGASRIIAGVNTGRRDAYRRMVSRGFRAGLIGVAMHRPEQPGTLRPDAYVIDDWR